MHWGSFSNGQHAPARRVVTPQLMGGAVRQRPASWLRDLACALPPLMWFAACASGADTGLQPPLITPPPPLRADSVYVTASARRPGTGDPIEIRHVLGGNEVASVVLSCHATRGTIGAIIVELLGGRRFARTAGSVRLEQVGTSLTTDWEVTSGQTAVLRGDRAIALLTWMVERQTVVLHYTTSDEAAHTSTLFLRADSVRSGCS
jgi:hypothetical protein